MLTSVPLDNNIQTMDDAALVVEKLRIAIISDAESERNGVGAYYHDLTGLLSDEVDAIELFSPGSGALKEGLSIPLPGDSTQRACFPPLRQLAEKFRALRPHVVIVPTPGPYGLFGAWLAKKYNARLIVGFHTHFEKIMDLYWSRWFGKLTVWYFETLNRYLFHRSTLILANSEEMLDVIRSRSDKPVCLMGTPVPQEHLKKPLMPKSGKIRRVLYAGRLAAEKNISTFIDAARDLPEIQFIVAGDGPEREQIAAADRELDNLEWLGWLVRGNMLDVLDNADMLVLPSHIESFGTVALEAMSRRKLALVSAGCGITDWPELQAGLLQYQSPETLSDAIRRVSQMESDKLLELADRARKGAEAVTEWNKACWRDIIQRSLQP